MKRFWIYERDSWTPKYRWLPYLGGDEYLRRTIVLAIPFGGYLAVALWKAPPCDDFDCPCNETQAGHRES